MLHHAFHHHVQMMRSIPSTRGPVGGEVVAEGGAVLAVMANWIDVRD